MRLLAGALLLLYVRGKLWSVDVQRYWWPAKWTVAFHIHLRLGPGLFFRAPRSVVGRRNGPAPTSKQPSVLSPLGQLPQCLQGVFTAGFYRSGPGKLAGTDGHVRGSSARRTTSEQDTNCG